MKNIVETAADSGNFKTLIRAVQEVGLVDSLSSEGPFTIFAPTDEAFEKLPDGTIDNLLNNKEELTNILTYHVIPEKIMSDSVSNLKTAKTANGKHIPIDNSDGIKIDNAKIIQKDIECSNGVIHVIDNVLLPE